jgi:hypothetical protein
MRTTLVFLLPALCAAAGMSDHPIVGVDEMALDAGWTARGYEKAKSAGCNYLQDTDFGRENPPSGHNAGKVGTSEECCAICAADSSCFAATWCKKGSGCDNDCWVKSAAEASNITYSRAGRVGCKKIPQPPTNTSDAKFTIPATVPGDLLTDLENAKLIGDPLFEFNFKNATLWANYSWIYSANFSLDSAFFENLDPADDVVLVFDGIKMGATVSLNGKTLGKATDQFLRYNYSIGDMVRSSMAGNSATASPQLEVAFDGTSANGRFMACTGVLFVCCDLFMLYCRTYTFSDPRWLGLGALFEHVRGSRPHLLLWHLEAGLHRESCSSSPCN